jgi:hypothetical protein
MNGKSSNRLIDKKEKILSLWGERCIKEVPSAGTEPSFALRDSLPSFLEHLSEALAANRKLDVKWCCLESRWRNNPRCTLI